MRAEPVADGATGVAGELVSNQVKIPLGKGLVERVPQREVPSGVARGGGLGERRPLALTQRAVDPDLVESPLIVQGRLDAVSVS